MFTHNVDLRVVGPVVTQVQTIFFLLFSGLYRVKNRIARP